jgi:putative protease
MLYKKEEIEIMAPVGSFESLAAAIQAKADSVYFGIEQLNMCAKSSNNFTTEDLKKIVEICNKNNIKSYLTVNTIIYDHDVNIMKQIVNTAKESGVSAIIVSDQAVMNYAKSIGLEVHISTQLNVSNIETVKFYANFADVMVLARELSLKQVKHITETIHKEQIKGPSGNLVQIEIFAHGALCMAVSGKCYLSLHEQNSSANRGACLQTCRKAYIVTEKETGFELEIDNEYIMSPKDLSTIDFVDKVLDAGVKVFKIEGRARPAEYVKITTESYKNAVNSVYEKTYTKEKIDEWIKQLSTVFNRGFWDGYYLGRKMGEWTENYGNQATQRKLYVGKITNFFKKIGVAEIKVEANTLSLNEEIKVLGPTTGVYEDVVSEIRLDDGNVVNIAPKGSVCSIKTTEMLRRGDKVYKVVPADITVPNLVQR